MVAAGAILGLGLAAAGPAAAHGQKITILHTSDLHGHVPMEQFVHVRSSEPSPTIAAMNAIGYQAMAVGNHEFNFGLGVLERARRQAEFPFLSANSVRADTGEPAFPPYLVIEAGAVRVGVLGLTTPHIPGWEMPDHYRGLRFQPMDEAARRWVPVLREKERCDLVVVLAHTGFERDLETGEPNGRGDEDYGWRLSEVPGINVLLTGHTHRDIPPRLLNGVVVSQPRSFARRLTRVDLDLARADGVWKIAGWHGENLRTEEVPGKRSLMAAAAPAHDRVVQVLNGPAGRVSGPVTVAGCRLADCPALDLIHAVQLAASGADLSLASLLTDRTPDLEAGPVTWRWVYSLYVYANTLVSVRLTGSQVRDLLEHTARYYDGLDCSGGDGWTVLTDPNVPHYNVDSMAGLSYRIDPTRPEGDRVRDIRYHGLPLDLHADFTVVCNSYRAAGGGGFPHLAGAEVVWKTPREMTDLIGDWLTAHDPWIPRTDDNWGLAPEITGESPLSAPPSLNRVTP